MKEEDKLGTLEEAIEFDKKRNYQYTAPQTKPLSDEEIKTLHEQTSWFGISDPIKYAKAIEERHGIK